MTITSYDHDGQPPLQSYVIACVHPCYFLFAYVAVIQNKSQIFVFFKRVLGLKLGLFQEYTKQVTAKLTFLDLGKESKIQGFVLFPWSFAG